MDVSACSSPSFVLSLQANSKLTIFSLIIVFSAIIVHSVNYTWMKRSLQIIIIIIIIEEREEGKDMKKRKENEKG
jgi:hypothetical protein